MATIDELVATGLHHHQAGRLQEAESTYRRVLEVHPQYAPALHLLGVVALQTKQPEAAIDLIRKAIALDPQVAEYHDHLGGAFHALGNVDEAIASFRQAIALDADNAKYHFDLANALNQQEPDQAILHFVRAVDLKPDFIEAYNNLGRTYAAQGNQQEALRSFRKALKVKPDYVMSLRNMYLMLKDLSEHDPNSGLCSLLLEPFTTPVQYRPDRSDLEVILQVLGMHQYACVAAVDDVKLIVDCGANIGCSALYFLHAYANAHVIAIEPDHESFELCRLNLAPYQERVTLLQSAVWSSSVGMTVQRGSYRDGREWAYQVRPAEDGEEAEVTAVTLDHVLDQAGHSHIDLLKIDIERAELELFSNDCDAWLSRTRNIAIELHDAECASAFQGRLQRYCFSAESHGELTVCRNIHAKDTSA